MLAIVVYVWGWLLPNPIPVIRDFAISSSQEVNAADYVYNEQAYSCTKLGLHQFAC